MELLQEFFLPCLWAFLACVAFGLVYNIQGLGVLICGLGAVIGLLLGVTLSLVQQYFGVIEIPAETFLTKSYPVELRLSDLFAVAVTFSLVSLLLADVTVRSMIKNTTRS